MIRGFQNLVSGHAIAAIFLAIVLFVTTLVVWAVFVHYPQAEKRCLERGGDRLVIHRDVTCWRANGTRVFLD